MYKLIVNKKLKKRVYLLFLEKYLDVMFQLKKIKKTALIKKIPIILRSDSNLVLQRND